MYIYIYRDREREIYGTCAGLGVRVNLQGTGQGPGPGPGPGRQTACRIARNDPAAAMQKSGSPCPAVCPSPRASSHRHRGCRLGRNHSTPDPDTKHTNTLLALLWRILQCPVRSVKCLAVCPVNAPAPVSGDC